MSGRMRMLTPDVETNQRFDALALPEPTSGCWLWLGSTNNHGYGKFRIGKGEARFMAYAHRYAYAMQHGGVPALDLDHRCRNTACVNPDHLEAVSHRENILRSPAAPPALFARSQTCKRGHLYDRVYPNGYRRCTTCHKAARVARRAARRGAA
jgi:hypothetical protein